MTVTMLSNTVDTNLILSNQVVIDMDNTIQRLEDDAAPLVKFSRRANQSECYSPKFEWLETELHPRLTTLAASYTTGTSVTVAAGTGIYFKSYDVIRNDATGENMMVTMVTGDVLTVQRGIGASNGYGGVSTTNSVGLTDNIIRLANASAEGSKMPALRMVKKVAKANYTQIIRTPFGFTNTLINTKLYGGQEPAQEAKQKLIEHLREIEHTFFWGQQKLDTTTGSTPRRFSGGLIDFITTNKTTSAGTLTQRTFDDFLGSAFRYGSGRKVLFCAPIIASAISSFALKQTVPTDQGSTRFGMNTTTYKSTLGYTVEVVVKPDWRDFQLSPMSGNGMGTAGFLVDMDSIAVRYLQNRNTSLKPRRQDNDEDSEKQEYLSEIGLQVNQERRHALITGVTNYTSGVT
jgi:hypothetical protein